MTSDLYSYRVGADATLKRFWKTVGVEKRDGGYAVTLDKRPLRTPGGKPLIIPPEKRLVAALVASEWENQETVLKPHALPMVSRVLLLCQAGLPKTYNRRQSCQERLMPSRMRVPGVKCVHSC